MAKVCLKCGYERKPQEFAPETECPKCGVVYAKVERALRETREKETQTPAPAAETPEISTAKEPAKKNSAAARMAELTTILETQSHLQKEQNRSLTLALRVVPSLFFGFGMFLACWKMFGPLIIFTGTRGQDSLTITFAKIPLAWAIITGGFVMPYFFRWFRDLRQALKS